MKKIWNVAHRGASALEPENTLRAIERAIELGADVIEVDVSSLSKDGHLIVMHDKAVDRTTNAEGYIFDMLLEELKNLDAGKGERIPTLQEIIRTVRGRARLLIDLKHPFTSMIERKLIDAIEQERMGEDIIITSSDGFVVKRLKGLNPELKIALLISSPGNDSIKLALDCGADILHLGSHSYVREEIVRNAHGKGLLVFVGNLNSVDEIEKLIEMGVDGITTDDPSIFPRAR